MFSLNAEVKEISEEETDKMIKFIIDKCKTLKEDEHIEIFKIMKKNNTQYTQNNNGIFINLNKIPHNLLEKIHTFRNY